jgi:hypothetical protein
VKGDRVEIVVDAGGEPRTYEVGATRAEPAVRRHAIVALHGPRQPNDLIQPAMACPISSGESSWR